MSKMILIDEATVKLALEALETVNRTDLSQVNLAIAAIKEALAEQAQQKPFGYIKPGEGDYEKVFSWNRNERNGYTQAVYTTPQPQPAQQEPVAWGWAIMHSDGTHAWIRPRIADFFGSIQEREPYTSEDAKHADREWAGLAPHTIVTLYTSPPAQRTWVGLTKQEFNECVDGLEDLEDCWTAIEAKLKEKNT